MTRRNGASQRDRILMDVMPVRDGVTPSRVFTDTERMLLHSYAKEQGILLFPEFDQGTTKRRRRRENPDE